jgi:hypothetical protein
MARFRGKGRRNGDRVFARTSMGPRKAAPGRINGGPRKGAFRNGPGKAARPGARPGDRAGKPDAIDQLLRNFK